MLIVQKHLGVALGAANHAFINFTAYQQLVIETTLILLQKPICCE